MYIHILHDFLIHFFQIICLPNLYEFTYYIADCIRKNMPAVDSKTFPVARSALTTPLARRVPPHKQVTGTSPAGGHVNTEHSSKLKQLNKHSQLQNYLALKWPSLTRGGVCTRHPPLPPAFDSLPPASHQQIAHGLGHSPEPALTEPPWDWSHQLGLCPNPGKNLQACSCEYGQMHFLGFNFTN